MASIVVTWWIVFFHSVHISSSYILQSNSPLHKYIRAVVDVCNVDDH